jgi:hypothetical protein
MRCLLVLLAMTLAGCAHLVIEPAGDTPVTKGIVYSLRETNLQANITYTVIQTIVYTVTPKAKYVDQKVKLRADGTPVIVSAAGDALTPKSDGTYVVPDDKQFVLVHKSGPSYTIVVRDPVELLPVTMSSRQLRFRLDPDAWENFAIAVNEAKIDLTDDGDANGFNIEFQDKTADMLTGFVKTGISIAKAVAVGGVDKAEEVELGKVKLSRFICIGDLATTRKGKEYILQYTDSPVASEFGALLNEAKFNTAVPESVKITLAADRDLHALSNTSAMDLAKAPPFEHGKLQGILFRVSAPVRFSVIVQDVPVYVGYKTVAQAGGLAWIPMGSKPFTNRKFALSLSPTSSGVKSYGFTGSSAGAGLANALDASSSSATSGIKDLNTLSAEQEIKRLTTERQLLEAQRLLVEEKKKPQ